MRRRLSWWWAVVLLLLPVVAVGAGLTAAGVTFFADDDTLNFGGTRTAADVQAGWETTGAEDHFSVVVPSGSGLLVSSDADVDRSGVIAAGSTYLGACSDDETSPNECVATNHTGVYGHINNLSGTLRLSGASAVVSASSTSTTSVLAMASSTTAERLYITADAARDQATIHVSPTTGDALILGDWGSYLRDFDHADPTNPTLFVHSATDPDTANDEWVSFAHDQTDGVIGTGSGDLKLAAGTHLKRYEKCNCNYDSGTAACVTGLAADDLVMACHMKVSVGWDGNGAVKCKTDTGESNVEIASYDNSKLAATGWTKGFGNGLKGTGETYALTGADDSVDCVATAGTSTQGTGEMYVLIESFQ
jgi:hypothetical protein|tara:strand:- start:1940 stop:3028 length:1089 start_codon:yes stop_codon:yes gene_type:complete